MLPPSSRLPVAKSATSVQLVPSQVSVFATAVALPPNPIRLLLEFPDPPNNSLAVFKFPATSVQDEPSQTSVLTVALGVVPPAITAAVVDPDPIAVALAVLIAVELVKDAPL